MTQPPTPQWDPQQGRWVLPEQGQPAQPYGQPSGQWPPPPPQQPVPAPAPRRRRKWPWIVGAALLLLFVIAVSSGGGTPDPAASSAAPTPTSSAAPAAPAPLSSAPATTRATPTSEPAAAGVEYEVSGTGRATSISYGGIGGTSQANSERLPWTKTAPAQDGFGVYSLTAQSGGTGAITCRITVGGKQIAEQTSTGQYAVVSCSGTSSSF